jgi:hypothetical protein
MHIILVLALLAAFSSGCEKLDPYHAQSLGSPMVDCEYATQSGQLEFTDVRRAEEGNKYNLRASWTGSEAPLAADEHVYNLTLASDCMLAEGLAVGSRVKTVWWTIVNGACAPSFVRFPELKAPECQRYVVYGTDMTAESPAY